MLLKSLRNKECCKHNFDFRLAAFLFFLSKKESSLNIGNLLIESDYQRGRHCFVTRNSKFELLRIISMVFVIASHFSYYGTWNEVQIKNSMHLLKVMQFQPLGQVGVYLFVMITAYFLSNRKVSFDYSLRKASLLWEKAFFYSILCLLLAFTLHLKISIKSILRSILPITFNQYWFITAYILLLFLLPMINQFMSSLDKCNFRKYMVVFILVADILPIVNNAPLGGFLSVSVLISAYLVSAYIKRFNIKISISISSLLILSGLVLQYLSIYILNELHKAPLMFTNGILPLMIATGVFTLMLRLPDFHSKAINYIAASVLAAYLLSVNHFFIRWIWKSLLHVRSYENSLYFTIIGLALSVVVLLACVLADKVFSYLIKLVRLKNN